MILVVDYNLRDIRFQVFKKRHKKLCTSLFIKYPEEIRDDKDLKRCVSDIVGKNKLKAISFRILFGGDCFKKTLFIDSKFFKQFEKLVPFFPLYIPSTLVMLRRFKNVFKETPLIAFFETSFFSKLPDMEKYYALPFKYYKISKIKKWGMHGISHKANFEISTNKEKSISVVLDKQTTVCAASDRKPLSMSLGYTPLEGIMSRTACGDLDPGIVFYLMNVYNFSIYKIDEMLKNKSGFVGLTGYDIGLKDMVKLRGKDDKVNLAFDVYQAQIMKYIGEGIAALGGLDNIIFSGSNVSILTPIVYDIVKKISFLGINTIALPWSNGINIMNITSEDSKIKVYINKTDIARIIFDESEFFMKKNLFPR